MFSWLSLKQNRWLPSVLVSMVYLLVQAARFFKIDRLPTNELIAFVPDDAFYYMVLGRNFSRLHRWTFDGTAPASGFHVLWGYLNAALSGVLPNLSFQATFAILFWFSALLCALALYLVCLTVSRRYGRFSVIGVAAIFLGYFSLQEANYLMESPLVLLSAATLVCLVDSGRLTTLRSLACLAIGFIGMLSRSDFGLLPFSLMIVWLVLRVPTWKLPAFAFLGALLGLAFVLLHSHHISGNFLQGSTRVKRHWSQVLKDDPRPSVAFVAFPLHREFDLNIGPRRATKDLARVVGFCCIGLLGSALAARRRAGISLLVAMSLVPLGYMAVYRFDAALQPWYFANMLVPYSIVAAAACSIRNPFWRLGALAVVAISSAHGIGQSMAGQWTSQEGFYRVGLFLKSHPELQPVAAWNVGIVHYFSGEDVINIDGLVNDDVDAYVISNQLPAYMVKRRVHYLADDRQMLTSSAALFAGYAGSKMQNCFVAEHPIFLKVPKRGPGDDVAIITLDQSCLQAHQ